MVNRQPRAVGRLAGELYERRRREILESIADGIEAMDARSRLDDDMRTLTAKVRQLPLTVAFRKTRQLFGAHIHAVYRVELPARVAEAGALGYRWGLLTGRRGFVSRRGAGPAAVALTARLNDDDALGELVRGGGVRAIGVARKADAWVFHLQPVAGVITVAFFPPIPPFAVPLKKDEVATHIDILRQMADAAREV